MTKLKKAKWDLVRRGISEHNKKSGRTLWGLGIACNAFCSGARLYGYTACSAITQVARRAAIVNVTCKRPGVLFTGTVHYNRKGSQSSGKG